MRIHAIRTGTAAVRRRQVAGRGPLPFRHLITLTDPVWTTPLPIFCWLVEHPEGLLLVDTGETARVAEPGWLPGWHPVYRRGLRELVAPEEELGPQLRRLGFDPSDVRRVVLTHLHTDHTGGLGHVAAAEALVSRVEHRLATGPFGRALGYLPHRWPSGWAPTEVELLERPFGPFTRSFPVTAAGDVVLLPTPGHTRGHLSVAIDEGDQVVILAGDASYTERLLVDGVADGVTDSPRTARATHAAIRALARERRTVYLPSHDPESPARLAERRPIDLPAQA